MSNFNWVYPNIVWFGNDRIKYLPKACKILKISKPLLLTDKDLVKTKMVQDTLQKNKKAKPGYQHILKKDIPTIELSDNIFL